VFEKETLLPFLDLFNWEMVRAMSAEAALFPVVGTCGKFGVISG
jgi:hypothetical protein